MLGIQLWIWLAVVSSVGAAWVSFFKIRNRSWVYRGLLAIGSLTLIWGVLPVLGGQGISPYLVVGAIVAFGFLVLSESIGELSG